MIIHEEKNKANEDTPISTQELIYRIRSLKHVGKTIIGN